ncbi:MAG: hypothetical protein ACTS2F_16555 [Thainema sp.]
MHYRLVRVEELASCDRASMFQLLNTHFAGVRIDVFNADLCQKNWVILLSDMESGELKGFSTLLMYQTEFEGEPISVVYSGDTIMDPSAWNSSTLSRAWIESVNTLRDIYPFGKLYWLLISSGYRTYRFLPVFWNEFYPRYDQPTPTYTAALMQHLANQQFGQYYNPLSGVVRFPHPHRLKGELSGIPTERLSDPHIQFFNQHNPGHINGDELVCLTEICEDNLTRAGRRMWFSKHQKVFSRVG